jgi:putative ABC transport system substrate-binding protein
VIDRRTFLAGTGAVLLAVPLAAEAQQAGKIYKIGILTADLSQGSRGGPKSFLQGLHDLGYVEGRSFVMEYRFAEGHQDRLPELAAGLVRARVDVMVTAGTPATIAAQRATQTLPIVFAVAAAVVEKGIVQSLARPGGNVTGLQLQVADSKGIQLLKDAVPTVTRVVFLYDPTTMPGERLGSFLRSLPSIEREQNLVLQPVAVSDPTGVPQAFAEFRHGTNGLMIHTASVLGEKADQICRLALQRKLPATGYGRVYAVAGCLVSYGESQGDMWRRAAVYVDKILKGAKPSDLPVELATKFDLVINLKTAKALGLTIPPSLLARADQVIE